jgi:hypothetical protein
MTAAGNFIGCANVHACAGLQSTSIDWGTVPQWVTAAIAVAAFGGAVWSIFSQREIARKRAAADFFFKTEMDAHVLEAHKRYLRGVVKLANYRSRKSLGKFAMLKACSDVRDYLNLHELIAVAIKRDVFDDFVCYDFWHRELARAYAANKDFIAFIQSREGDEQTYVELVELAKRWAKGRPKRSKIREFFAVVFSWLKARLMLAFTLLYVLGGSVGAETVDVKYRGPVDLKWFACTDTPRSSFIAVSATTSRSATCSSS